MLHRTAWLAALVACVIVASGRSGSAQTSSAPTSLEALVEALVAQNSDVARARLQAQLAAVAVEAALAPFDPVLSSELRLTRAEQPTDDGLSSGTSVSERIDFGFNYTQQVRFGTRLQAGLDVGRARSVFPLSSDFFNETITRGPNWTAGWSVVATQPLLRGRGRATNLLARLVAQHDVRAADAATRQAAATALAQLLEAVVQLRFASAELEVRRAAIVLLERRERATQAEIDAGRVAPIDIDLVYGQLLAARETVLIAEAAIDAQRALIEQITGVVLQGADVTGEVVTPATLPQDPCATAAALAPQLVALRASRDTARLRARQPRDASQQQLDLSVGLTSTGLDAGLGVAAGQSALLRAPTIFGALTWSMTVRNRAIEAQIVQADLQLATVELDLEAAERALCGQIQVSQAEAALADARLGLALERAAVAERAVEADLVRFAQGLSTTQAGLELQRQLADAELEVARVARDRDLALLDIASATGVTAGRWLAELSTP